MPDILIMSEHKRYATKFQLVGGEDNAARLFAMFDIASHGRLDNSTCEEIEKISEEFPTLVYFGDEKLMMPEMKEDWNKLTRLAYVDRRDYPHEPMNFVWNNDEECKKTYGANPEGESLVMFDPGFNPTHVTDYNKLDELKVLGPLNKWKDHTLLKHQRMWNYRQLMTFENSAHFMVAWLPTQEQWVEEREFKEETGRNGIQVQMVLDVCDKLVEEKADVVCVIAPLNDTVRDNGDSKVTDPITKFPTLMELKDDGTPIYVMAMKDEKLHQFPKDLTLPENQDPTIMNDEVLHKWVKYWHIKDTVIPQSNSALMQANAFQSMELYEQLDENKKELEILRDDLEARDIKVRVRKGETGYLTPEQRKEEMAKKRKEKEEERVRAKKHREHKREEEKKKQEKEEEELRLLEEQGETIEL